MAMDQATARRLLSEGGFFVFLNVPEGTEFGIDMKSWNTGERFRGVKMIPPGLHFIFYSSVSETTEDVAPRTGFFHNFNKSEVLVRKWDAAKEDMSIDPVNESEIVSLKQNMAALDNFLGPYPYDILEKWKSLTSHITDELVGKLMPISGKVMSALELQSLSDKDRPRRSKQEEVPSCSTSKKQRTSQSEEDFLPNLQPLEGTALRFTTFPEKQFPENATPAEITQHSLDSTYVLETVLKNYTTPHGFLGELEFCFVCFLVGHSLEAFEQWKKLVTLLCNCDVAVNKYKRLYESFISLLEVQIREIPEEFLADIVTNNNFVYVNLRNLFRTVLSSNVDANLRTKIDHFQAALKRDYMWDFNHLESEDEDEAPVIVHTE